MFRCPFKALYQTNDYIHIYLLLVLWLTLLFKAQAEKEKRASMLSVSGASDTKNGEEGNARFY